jgi:geranylgeranyl diphosphate synthase type II
VESCLGLAGLVGGQAHDLRGWREGQDVSEVIHVAAMKTATLLRLPVVLPALIGCGTDREVRLLDRLALLRGLAYQAADDLKDVLCLQNESGKTSGRDDAMGRPNLALAEGVTAASQRFQRLQDIGDRVQSRLPGPPERWWMLPFMRVASPWPGIEEDTVAV